MFFPWVGLFEQLCLADVFVHYDDVQYSKGSFTNRVQAKTPQGIRWLTVPLHGLKLGQQIREVAIDPATDWKAAHIGLLTRSYAGAPHLSEMLDLVRGVYAVDHPSVGALSAASMEAVCRHFGFPRPAEIHWSSHLGIGGSSSQRVLDIVRHFGGTRYVTGLGARNYLDHELFERHGIAVEYMDYRKLPYPQLHGEFTPYVSVLDLIANCGKAGAAVFASGTIPWRQMVP